jgi:hypothetical protein
LISHLMVIAIGFRLTGALLGVASIAALVDLADTALMLRRLPPPDTSAPLDIGTYGLVGLLDNGARGVSKVLLALLTGPGAWLVTLLTIAASLSLVFALLLYLTGRGIGHHAMWARIIAILMSIGLTAASCAIAAAMRSELAPIALLPAALSLYTLWVLIWRFA